LLTRHPPRTMSSSEQFLGSLAAFQTYDVTAHIGTTFPDSSVQLSSFLTSPHSEDLIGDLARLISYRGVVFFSEQNLTVQQQKDLMLKLGELTGRPESSTLHKHPISEDIPELGADVSIISSVGGIARAGYNPQARASNGWHSDISFEKVPADYSILKMHTLPKVGGDTLWASAYEAYDRLSGHFKKFLEGLTAVHDGNGFIKIARARGLAVQKHRGSPENDGEDLTAIHPVIRTHPVTGYKALFINKGFTRRIVELSQEESDHELEYLFRHISENHNLQVRYRWNKNDVAIWDNRAVYHTATNDYSDLRQGNRVVGIGEKPYFDEKSKSRREQLGITC